MIEFIKRLLAELFAEPEQIQTQRDKNMKLSNNFSLAEMLKSETALRLDIDNVPNDEEIDNMIALCENVLQPVRDELGRVNVNSGFRCLELNRALKSKDTSQHTKGEAADIEIYGLSNYDLAEWIQDNLEFDQLILEFWYDEDDEEKNPTGDPNMGWVHVSYKANGDNRNQVLTINKYGVFPGLGY